MTVPFMRAYTELLVRTCHRRAAHAIGGMAAFIPNRRDAAVTEVALARVREDKVRESADGFDGTWVAHPDLVPIATEVFDGVLGDRPHQKDRRREEVSAGAAQPSTFAYRAARSARPAFAPTCGSRSPISTAGCAATARPRSTT
jgi:malate synthase